MVHCDNHNAAARLSSLPNGPFDTQGSQGQFRSRAIKATDGEAGLLLLYENCRALERPYGPAHLQHNLVRRGREIRYEITRSVSTRSCHGQ